MKNKKRLDQIKIFELPAPAGWKKLKTEEKEEEKDPATEFAQGEIEDQLIEAIGEKIDAYFALTGEPITAALSFLHQAFEIAEMANGAGLVANARNGGKTRTVVITPSRLKKEKEQEEDFTL